MATRKRDLAGHCNFDRRHAYFGRCRREIGSADMSKLGRAAKVISTKDKTVIVGGKGKKICDRGPRDAIEESA